MNQTTQPLSSPCFAVRGTRQALMPIGRLALLFVLLVGLLAASAQAQTARFRSSVVRVTAPLNFNGNLAFTNLCTVSGLVNPVDLTISGLPSGATATISGTNGALPLDGGFPSTVITTNLLIIISLNGTVAEGLYPLTLNASGGAVNNWAFDLQVAALWSGASYLSGVSTNWNNVGNWVAGSVPGAADDVVFGQAGTTNAVTITNIFVTSDVSIASLRFAPTNNGSKFFTMQINPGVTLGLGGTKGFGLMKDYLNALSSLASGMNIVMTGGGTLAVTNKAANFISYVDNSVAYTMDFSGLGNLVADVNQFSLADYSLFPNYRNWNDLNAYSGQPRSALPIASLARTNIIKSAYVDPYNYTNSDSRHYGFSLFQASELSGSGTQNTISLGISNIFYCDSVCFIGPNSRGNVVFNSIFAASNPIAIFRSTNGGRMSVFTESDGGATNTANSNIKATVDFTKGALDMLVDRFYIGRDRVKIQSLSTPNYQGIFMMGKGILDANTMILGFREHAGEATNAAYGYSGYCEGQLTVSNTGVIKINKSLTLGYTAESNINGLGSAGNTEYGQVTIRDGASMFANTINVGGPVYMASKNNFLFVSNNASLNISNYCGGPLQMLDSLTLANGSTLTLTLNPTSTVAAVYATNYNIIGSNSLVIAAIKNPGSLVNGQKIPLFEKGPAASFPALTLINQSGVNGQIVLDTDTGGSDANLKVFQVILNQPKTLLWKAYSSADWDNLTANWLDLNTGLHTNFAAGDTVIFDDSASQFSINLVSGATILPGSLLMTNIANAYIINNSGGGIIIGSATLQKFGTNSLQVDGPSSISVNVNVGSLTGSGSIGAATVSSGANMNFLGNVSGNLTSVGTAAVYGTVNGAVVVQSGGVITNGGTMNSTFSVNSGGLFVNNPGASLASIGSSSSVAAGGVLFNRGNIAGANLSVSGTFKDTGEGTTTLTGTFTANSGAVIIPGGDGVGTTTIASGTASGFPGRVLLSQGSTNIFKVDILGSANSKLLSGYQDFGGSSSVRSQNGCTIVITNVTGSFAAGQSFTLFQYFGGGTPIPTGSSTNTYPVISPSAPAPGLAWDLTQLWPLGVIGVTTNIGPFFTNTFTIEGGTNIIGQFSWNAANLGWRLQNKVVPLGEGLNSTNPWAGVPGSWTNITVLITNTITTNNVFYRLSFP